MTPYEWKSETIGKSYDTDKAYGYQCWDYFDAFIKYFNLPVSTYCALTGYVCDLWRLRDKYGYSQYFEYIYKASDLRDGDWCFFDKGSESHPASHTCMYFSPDIELGQNQGKQYVTEKQTTFSDMLGALRFKNWSEIKTGASDITINDHSYSLYRQEANQKAVVLSAGIDKLQSIRELDADVYVMAKICGANYFQARTDMPDGQQYGMTFGDISAPLNDVWRELPNQDTTLYFDLNTGLYGDCTGVHIDQTHDVYSPAVVYPATGNFQYARMVGVDHVNTVSRYTFCIRFADGSYALGIANDELTPKQIATDFRQFDIDSISFLDGGGSAQFGRWNGTAFEYLRDTGREVPSAVAIVSTEPIQNTEQAQDTENGAESNETEKDEEQSMNENTSTETAEIVPVKDETYTDPEATIGNTLLDRLAALLSVKSIITLFLTAIFGLLVLNDKELPEQFVSIYTMCISFFFGYQFRKSGGGD